MTSTFFEGHAAGNAQATRGYSRDHRPDCPQVCLGLVVSPEGLPLAYAVFAGNRTDVTERACGWVLAWRLERSQWTRRAHGAYWLRTDCRESDPAQLWEWYRQLQQAEAAFRIGQSDLLLRPIFHQKTKRVEARILICFLALALWRTLEQWMKSKGKRRPITSYKRWCDSSVC